MKTQSQQLQSRLALVLSWATIAVLNDQFPVAAQTNCVAAPAGLVSWWKGESNALDSSNTNHGVLRGNVGFGLGNVGNAFNFNGSSYVEVPSSPSISPTGPFAVEAWVKFSQVSSSASTIVAKGSDCNCIID